MKKRFGFVLAAMLGTCLMSGCSGEAKTVEATTEVAAEAEETAATVIAAEETGEAQTENNEENAILVVSFGTSHNDSRDMTIGAIETAIADAFPEYDIRRAFTSQTIIDILKERDNLEIDNVTEALDRAVADGVKELLVQPTHLMNGIEYSDLAKELSDYVDQFERIVLAEPLLMSDADFDSVADAITEKTAVYDDGKTAICFMGHGTEDAANAAYGKIQETLLEKGFDHYYVGTVEADPSLDDVIEALEEKGIYEKVVLEPLMVVAGDHAKNDMAGEEADSWKSILESKGYEVECILEGLGQIPAVQEIYADHIRAAAESEHAFTGVIVENSEEPALVMENGNYSVEVTLNGGSGKTTLVSPAVVSVNNGSATAVIQWSSPNYDYMIVNGEKYLPMNTEGDSAFEIPVEAFDEEIPVIANTIAMSKPHEIEYTITFHSDSVVETE